MRKANEGFTLIELMAGIVCVTLVMGAAMSMMLMGQRTNRALSDAVSEQQTARIITTMLEKIASEGAINWVESDTNNEVDGHSWWLVNEQNNSVVFSYSEPTTDNTNTGKIWTGKVGEAGSSVLMDGITSCKVALEESSDSGRLLTFMINTKDNSYKTSVYCRLAASNVEYAPDESDGEAITVVDKNATGEDGMSEKIWVSSTSGNTGRFQLLRSLCSQFGSTGYILGSGNVENTFSKWYCGGSYWDGWDANTPWCGCFLSWGVAQPSVASLLEDKPKFANVDKGREYFEGSGDWHDAYTVDPETNVKKYYEPTPADFIFFSWDNDESTLEHVGAVFAYENGYVYTIEGNSGGKVALHRYEADDPRIIGYGVLDWK